METRKQKAARNIVSSISLNVFNILIGFVGRIIFLRVLDAYYLGINGLFTNILSVLSMADLGLNTAMMYSLYKPIAQNDIGTIKSLIAFFKKVYLAIALVVFVLGMAVVPFLDYLINMDREIEYITFYYIVSLLNIVVSYLFVYRTILISADQKQYITNKITFYFKIATFVLQMLVLLVFRSYALYVISALLILLVSNFVLNAKALNMYPYLKEKAAKLPKEQTTGIRENIKSLFIYKVSGVLINSTSNIYISVLISTVMVGFYSNYLMLITQVTTVLNLFFEQLKVTVGNKIATESQNKASQVALFYRLEFANYWIVSFCSIAFFVLFNDFIALVFGAEYVLGISVVFAIVLSFYTSNIRQSIWIFRETTGIFKQAKYVTLITALLNLFFSAILGYTLGLFGIIISTFISRMLYAWWREPQILFCEYFKTSPKFYFFNYILKLALLFGVAGITFYCVHLCSFENIYINFIAKMILCTIIPNVIFLLIFFRTKEFAYYWNIAKGAMSKLKSLKK